MKSFRRRIHDIHANLRAAVHLYPKIESDPGSAKQVTVMPLIEAGEESVSCELEARFKKQTETSTLIRWPSVNLYRVENATVVGDQANVFLANGKWLRVCPSLGTLPLKKVRPPIYLGATKLNAPMFHLSGRDHENHGHFLFQHMPRWLAAQKKMQEANPHFKILVAKGHLRWQSRYLTRTGASEEQILECGDGTSRCKDLYYLPQLRGQDACISRPQDYRSMNEFFHRSQAKTERALFLSRKDAPNRYLINEDEAIAEIEKVFGSCRSIQLSKTPLDQQIDLISSASVVVGPLGQALATSLFARGSIFINLDAGHGPDSWGDAFRDVATICGNRALSLYSKTPRTADGSFTFPPDALRQMLERVKMLIQ
ncbi:glycosyltransferase family 61 protein [Prosthecobacter fluviatilis]|uniref:Glycosyltransferase family 61 protein n=1 Tax=Prosthecobacter fluviatilis TaxID=445931 RepID=A0ABW0KMS5_9BACT